MNQFNDISDLHLGGRFKELWPSLIQGAVIPEEHEKFLKKQHKEEARLKCRKLASKNNILKILIDDIRKLGVVGEERAILLLYLTVTSRFFKRPISAVVKGPSSAGKSFIVEQTLRFFPESAYYALSSMSEKALIYLEEPLQHRILVLYEAAGLNGELVNYLVRSLLSEGRISYATVIPRSLKTKQIVKEGPTGLITTTTKISLNKENETRMLSIPVTDTKQQTQDVMMSLAAQANADLHGESDFETWHNLQEWLSLGEFEVIIPFAKELASLIRPEAVRMRRDFKLILTLIQTHTLLHQANRKKVDGKIVASLEDYEAVRDLVDELVSEGVHVSVQPKIRQVVEVVARLNNAKGATKKEVARELGDGYDAVSRRINKALAKEYLQNIAEKSRPCRIIPGEPMPDDRGLLPTIQELVANLKKGTKTKANAAKPSQLTKKKEEGHEGNEPVCTFASVASDKTKETNHAFRFTTLSSKPCYWCKGIVYWHNGGEYVCESCHPCSDKNYFKKYQSQRKKDRSQILVELKVIVQNVKNNGGSPEEAKEVIQVLNKEKNYGLAPGELNGIVCEVYPGKKELPRELFEKLDKELGGIEVVTPEVFKRLQREGDLDANVEADNIEEYIEIQKRNGKITNQFGFNDE